MTSNQGLFFAAAFLIASVAGNIGLFLSNTAKVETINNKTLQISELTDKLSQQGNDSAVHATKIQSVDKQQQELVAIVGQLQKEITAINDEYQMSVSTAELTAQKLVKAQAHASELSSQLNDLTQQLSEANKTISNQQRAIRSRTNDSDLQANENIQRVLDELTTALNDDYETVGLRQDSDGTGVIDIPLELVFISGTLELNETSRPLLATISNAIIESKSHNISIIGHSDARPIVSSLGELYPTNWELSSVRASKVAQQMIDLGVNGENIIVSGKASNAPIREEANAEAWKINRRIEIKLKN